MEYIKVGNKKFFTTFIKDFNEYKAMLQAVMVDNKNAHKWMFTGCFDENKQKGILISGPDINNIRDITRFFPVSTIEELFNKSVKDSRLLK